MGWKMELRNLDTLSRKYGKPMPRFLPVQTKKCKYSKYGLPGLLRLLIPYADECPNNLSAIFQAIVNCWFFGGPLVDYLDF